MIYVSRQPDVYEAQASIQIGLENNPALGSSKNGSVIINNPGDDPSYFNTQLLLLKSPAFLRRVVKTLSQEQGSHTFAWASSRRETTWSNVLRMVGLTQSRSHSDNGAGELLRPSSIAPMSPDGDMSEAERLEPYVATIRRPDVSDRKQSLISFNSGTPTKYAARAANVVADTLRQANGRGACVDLTAMTFGRSRSELHSKIGENERRQWNTTG